MWQLAFDGGFCKLHFRIIAHQLAATFEKRELVSMFQRKHGRDEKVSPFSSNETLSFRTGLVVPSCTASAPNCFNEGLECLGLSRRTEMCFISGVEWEEKRPDFMLRVEYRLWDCLSLSPQYLSLSNRNASTRSLSLPLFLFLAYLSLSFFSKYLFFFFLTLTLNSSSSFSSSLS